MKKAVLVLVILACSVTSFAQDRGASAGVKGGGSDISIIHALMWSHPHKTPCEIAQMALEGNPQLADDQDFISFASRCVLPLI